MARKACRISQSSKLMIGTAITEDSVTRLRIQNSQLDLNFSSKKIHLSNRRRRLPAVRHVVCTRKHRQRDFHSHCSPSSRPRSYQSWKNCEFLHAHNGVYCDIVYIRGDLAKVTMSKKSFGQRSSFVFFLECKFL